MRTIAILLALFITPLAFAQRTVRSGSADAELKAAGYVKIQAENGGWFWGKPGEREEVVPDAPSTEENRATDNPANASYRVRVGNSYGSGTAISRNIVVTNAHVVGQRDNAVVLDQPPSRQGYSGRVIESDASLDLAFVKSDSDLRFAEYSGTDPVEGQSCKLYGYPYAGQLRTREGHVTANAMNGAIPKRWLSIQVRPGDSGGGVFDSDNRLVAITNMMGSDGECSALPISLMVKLTEQYKSRASQEGIAFTESFKCDKCGAYHSKGVELTQL